MAVWRTAGQPFARQRARSSWSGCRCRRRSRSRTRGCFAESQQRAAELDDRQHGVAAARRQARRRRPARVRRRAGPHVCSTADIAYVALLEPAQPASSLPLPVWRSAYRRSSCGEGSTSRIITSGKPLIINGDADRADARGRRPMSSASRARSYLGVPIRVGRHEPRRAERPEHADRERATTPTTSACSARSPPTSASRCRTRGCSRRRRRRAPLPKPPTRRRARSSPR